MSLAVRPRAALSCVVLLGTLALGGCGSDDPATPSPTEGTSSVPPEDAAVAAARAADPTFEVVAPATIRPGDPIARPTGKVVLTIKGGDVTNVGNTLQLDLATLEQLGTVGYTVYDRQAEGRDVAFSGPLLRTLLDVAGAHGSVLHTVALNDYAVDIPAGDADELPVLLATRADGRPMSVARYGPTRIVYPTAGYDLDATVYDPRWIWQLASIQAR